MSEKKKSGLVNYIWLVTIVPLAIAWTMAYTGFGLPDSTKNNGELMPAGLTVPDKIVHAQDGHWGLVVVSDTCDDTCQQQLYRAQQLYISMGKEAERIRTVWISNDVRRETEDLTVDIKFKELADDNSTKQPVLIEVNFQNMAQINDNAAFEWFKTNNTPWQDQSIFFVDPNGILVLRFNPELPGRDMMSDIKWLLKASRLG
tara:strand:- start:469 stop:1074 length:606 start_codon:yes stop_codon:yes gene_type:complete